MKRADLGDPEYKEILAGSSYVTDAKKAISLRNYLLFGTRWRVYSYLFGAILAYRPMAVRNEYNDDVWAASSLQLLRNLERCGARFTIDGIDNVKDCPGPAVYISNHKSTLETLILPGLIAPLHPCTFVAKQSLAKGPIWGPVMRSRNPILVTRTDPRKDLATVLEEGTKNLSLGRSIILFPEGTRKKEFVRSEFNSLGIKLAVRAGVPVIPVAVKTEFWGNSPLLRGFGPIHEKIPVRIAFGKPIAIQGRGRDEHEAVLDFIENKLKEWENS